MKVIEQTSLMQQTCRFAARPLVLVPTMGALHEGHAALFRYARQIAGSEGTVAVSIFLNPKQFNSVQDLELYPRPFARDRTLCEQAGADLIFHPSVEEMYAADSSVQVQELKLSQVLCGASRPGHFTGVATVVSKLFNIAAPDIAIFGEKDWQQLTMIRHLVRDLNFPIVIKSHPIVREEDGLAMSSRNARLSPQERKASPKIYQTLQAVAAAAAAGEKKVNLLLAMAQDHLTAIPGATVDYIEIRNEETLESLQKLSNSISARLLIAVEFGNTRLIDNIAVP